MSSIFGFITNKSNSTELAEKALTVWNRSYGTTEPVAIKQGNLCIGSALNHLTDTYPEGPSVLQNEDVIAVIDVVLYNREELGTDLGISNLSSVSDEQLLLRWICEKGFYALSSVNGDFSGAVYSKKDRSITLFRDHTGIRPLFYYKDSSMFAFSTDIRGLTALPESDTSFEERIFFEKMMGFNELTIDHTDYQNILCVKPAHYMTIRSSENGFDCVQTCYWKLGSRKIHYRTDKEYEQEMYRLVKDAIDIRAKAVSGIKGCELSGGLDSSVIAIILSRLGNEGVFYSWSYDPSILPIQKDDERQVILDICEQENISCIFQQKTRVYTSHTFEECIEQFAVPYVNTFNLSEGSECMRRHGAKVVFSGHGGDEGISHRPNIYEMFYNHEYLSYAKAIYRQQAGKSLRILRTIKNVPKQAYRTYKDYNKPFSIDKAMGHYLNPEFKKQCFERYSQRRLDFHFDVTNYILNGGPRVRLDTAAVLSSETGVQYMFPFLDYRVLDFAVSIPRRLYNDGIVNRKIYRNAFDHLMPESLKKVNTKIYPSLLPFLKGKDFTLAKKETDLEKLRAQVLERKKKYLGFLDRSFWEKYLDMEKLENFGEGPEFSYDDFDEFSEFMNELALCSYLQNVGVNIKEYTREL